MFNRRTPEPPPPERIPHPDPRVEVKLQQVISMRRAATRNEGLLDGHQRRVQDISDEIAKHPTFDGTAMRRKEVAWLSSEITRLNAENTEIHEQVAELCAKLSDDDIAWLDRTGL